MTNRISRFFSSVGRQAPEIDSSSGHSQLKQLESTYDSIWRGYKNLFRDSRNYPKAVEDFLDLVKRQTFSYTQFCDAKAGLAQLEDYSSQSRKLRSRLNRLIYKTRQFAKTAEIELPLIKHDAQALLGEIRSIEVSVSDLAKEHEILVSKLTKAIRSSATLAQNFLGDEQFKAGFVEAAIENYTFVLFCFEAVESERVYAARKILALSLIEDRGGLAEIARPYFSAHANRMQLKAADVAPYVASSLAGRCAPGFFQTHEAIGLAKSAKSVDALMAVSTLLRAITGIGVASARTLQSNWICAALAQNQLEAVTFGDRNAQTQLDGIAAQIPEDSYISGVELVSVIMPARNSQTWIETAMRSVLNQTWRSIELIVVDDASDDQTLEVVQRVAQTDSRVVVISSEEQRGAYGARNLALEVARGDFITVHDADDWSHPRKIEIQAKSLLANPMQMANLTQSARVRDEDMSFHNYLGREILRQNSSSLMARREVFETLGFWDEVMFGADSEFHHRVLAAYGSECAPVLDAGVLSFTRYHSESLTGGGIGGMALGVTGAREQYALNFAQWHAQNAYNPELLRMERAAQTRPFEVPNESSSALSERHMAEVLVAGDFSEDGLMWQFARDLLASSLPVGSITVRHEPRVEDPGSIMAWPATVAIDRVQPLDRRVPAKAKLLVISAEQVIRQSVSSSPIEADFVLLVGEQIPEASNPGRFVVDMSSGPNVVGPLPLSDSIAQFEVLARELFSRKSVDSLKALRAPSKRAPRVKNTRKP